MPSSNNTKKKLNKNNYNYLNSFYENFKKLIKITNMPKATLPDDEKKLIVENLNRSFPT